MERGAPGAEMQKAVISQSQVWGEFESFQGSVQVGFKTHEQSLQSYGRMLHVLDGYLDQEHVRGSNDAKTLVRKLFYSHDTVSSLPIGFFLDTRGRLNEEVLEHGNYQPVNWQWDKELDFIQAAVRQELQRVSYDVQLERADSQKIEKLASQHQNSELSASVKEDLALASQERQKRIREVAVVVLSHDPQFGQEIQRVDKYIAKLDLLMKQDLYSEEDLKRELLGFEDFLAREDGRSALDEMTARLRRNQPNEVKRVLSELKSKTGGEDKWIQFVSRGLVPADLLSRMGEIEALAEFQETLKAVSGLPKEGKAYHLRGFLEKGLTAGLLLEVIEGRFGLGEDLVASQVDAFTHFYDVYKEYAKKGLSLKQKLVLTAAAGMVLSSVFAYWATRPSPESLDAILDEISQEDKDLLQGFKFIPGYGNEDIGEYDDETPEGEQFESGAGEHDGSQGGRPGRGGPGGESENSSERQSQESDSPSSEFNSPKNDSPENLEKEMKRVVWRLQGKDLRRFYQTHSATYFDNRSKSWVSKNDFNNNFQDTNTYSYTDIILSNTIKVDQLWVRFPIPAEHRFSKVLKFAGVSGRPNLYRSSDGDYMLRFSKQDLGKEVQVSYGAVKRWLKSDYEDVKPPTEAGLKEASRRLVNVKELPEDVQKFLADMNKRQDLSAGLKAKVLEKFIETSFKYSLDTKWSNHYRKGKNTNEFIKRIFEIRKTDCDVANTALVALLRSQGIPARMIFGYGHESEVFNPVDKTLTAAEGHGIAQAYINGKWIYLDGTPTELDDFTKEAFEKLGKNKDELEKGSPTQGAKSDGFMESLDKFFGKEDMSKADREAYDLVKTVLLIYLLNAASWLGANRLRIRNSEIIERLDKELVRRGMQYFGPDFTESRFELVNREEWRLMSKRKFGDDMWTVFIPPTAFINSLIKIKDTINIASIPYNNGQQEVDRPEVPATIDLLTTALGYEEDEVRRRMYNSAFRESIRRLDIQVNDTIEPLGRGIYDEGAFTEKAHKTIEKMPKPKDIEQWEVTKRIVSERLYTGYLKEYNRSTKEFERAKGWHGFDKVQEARITREEFDGVVEELFGYQILRWQLRQSRKEALAQLDLSFKDRILELVGEGENKVM